MTAEQVLKRRWYGHPFVIGALLLLLLVDLISIPSDHYYTSTVKHEILRLRFGRSTAHGRPVPGKAFKTETGIEWRWPTDVNYDAIRPDVFSDQFQYGGVFRSISRYSGLYHMTRRTESFEVWSDELSTEDQQKILDAILAALERDPSYDVWLGFVPELIRSGVRTRSHPIYFGYFRNGFSVLVMIALIFCSSRGRPLDWCCEPWFGMVNPFNKRKRRLSQGQCVACGYDLAGLKGAVCPECGSARETSGQGGDAQL